MMKKALVAVLVVILTGGGALFWRTRPVPVAMQAVSRGPLLDVLSATGVVEARSVILSPKAAGRVAVVAVREGQQVTAGQLLLHLAGDDLEAQVDQARAALRAAEAQRAQAEAALRLDEAQVRTQIDQAAAVLAAARALRDKARAGARNEEIGAAQAQVALAAAADDQAARDLERAHTLYTDGAIGRAQVDQAETALAVAQAQLTAAREQLALVMRGARAEDLRAVDAEVDRAEAALRQAQDGRRILAVRGAQIQAASAQVNQAHAAVRAAESQLGEMEIRAPFAGTLVGIPVEIGQLVAPGMPVIELADLADRWVSVAVESDDLTRFEAAHRSATRLEITAEAFPGRTFQGRVREMASMAVRGAGGKEWTVQVKVALDDPLLLLRPGMEVDLDATVPLATDALRVPKEGVLEVGGRAYVFVWNGAALRRSEVTTGQAGLSEVEVRAGVREGDHVVASGLEHLRRGHRVAVRGRR